MTLIKRKKSNKMSPLLYNDFDETFDIDSLLNESFMFPAFSKRNHFSRIPAANICDKNKEFIIEIAIPGMRKKDFNINIDNNLLEIEVEKEEELEKEKENYTKREYDYTSIYRSFKLPELVLSDEIKAEYENGILKIHLPKAVETKRKPIKEIDVM